MFSKQGPHAYDFGGFCIDISVRTPRFNVHLVRCTVISGKRAAQDLRGWLCVSFGISCVLW